MAYQLQFGDGMNFYEYLRSNPVNGKDPSGLFLYVDLAGAQALQTQLSSQYVDVSASFGDAGQVLHGAHTPSELQRPDTPDSLDSGICLARLTGPGSPKLREL